MAEATELDGHEPEGLLRRRRALIAMGAGAAVCVAPSVTSVGRSAAATGSTGPEPTVPEDTVPTTEPTTTTTEATTTTTTAPVDPAVLDHDLSHAYGSIPVSVGNPYDSQAWQVIIPTFTGTLRRFVVRASGTVVPLTANVYRARAQGSFRFPDGAPLGSASINPNSGASSHSFALAVPVEAGTEYVIVLSVASDLGYWTISFGNPSGSLTGYRKLSYEGFPTSVGSLTCQTWIEPS